MVSEVQLMNPGTVLLSAPASKAQPASMDLISESPAARRFSQGLKAGANSAAA